MNNNHRDKIRMRQRATEKDKVPWRGLATVLSSEEGTRDTGDRRKLAGEAASAQSQNAPRPLLSPEALHLSITCSQMGTAL